MKSGCLKIGLVVVLVLVAVAVVVTLVRRRGEDSGGGRRSGEARVMPVEVEAIGRGRMEWRRLFSGTLEASAELKVAPKIAGRIARILVDLSDRVERGDEVALLDDAEYAQAVSSARADLAVATAQAAEAANRLELAERELARMRTLEERGVASAAALDTAETEFIMRRSALQVAQAGVQASEAALATAEIRLSYTRITAVWSEGDDTRVVAERFANEGDTVAANTPLFSVVRLQPVRAVFFVPERDYVLIQPGQRVDLFTDAFPGEAFPGEVSRVSPVFREDSRQARVEIVSANADERLKPGMFVRARAVLQTVEDAVHVPQAALSSRAGEIGVFLLDESAGTVDWVTVQTGIESDGRVQIVSPAITGRVVTLGHQLLADGVGVHVITAEGADQ